MAVTIVGTLEQIYTSGGDTVSEAVHVNFESPTDVPLPLHESIVFTERNPPVDIRYSLEAHLVDDHGFTSVTRVAVTRDGAMAEWTAIRPDSIPADIVLWFLSPLQQEGVEWGLVAVGNTSIVGSGYRSVEIGEDASSAAEGSIAIGPESTVPETSPRSVAIGEGAFIPENTPDRAVLRSKELWVRPHEDADRVDSAVILQDSGGNSRTIRATAANSLTVNGVPVGGGSNTAVWGGISGSISNQADLTAALNSKEASLGTGTTSQFLRGDKTWVTPPNTTYSEITEAEISAGTASTLRTISGRRAQAIVNKAREGMALASSIPTQLAQLDTTVTGTQLNALKAKVDGVATGATKNQTDAYLLNRGNHTGNQPIHTITNLQEILDGKPLEVDPGNRSTAIGVDAQAIGNSSFAAGDTAIAGGVNSIAIGVDSNATGSDSTAIGQGAEASGQLSAAVGREAAASEDNTTALGNYATASGEGATAVGGDAGASGTNATAVGFLSEATGNGASATGVRAKAHGQASNAVGLDARVPATSPRSQAFGAGVVIPENTSDTTVIGAAWLEIKPGPLAIGNISTITLYDAAGNPHTITHEAAYGQTHSYSYNTSPGGENLTGVGTYSTAGVLQSGTLQSFIPAITSGLWDVDIEAHALVYRSVATGGVYLFVGNGTSAYQQALGRLSPQTHAYTLNVNVSPSIAGGTALKAVTPSQIIDMRYTGFQTAGTTTVINHGWKITARRVG